MDRFLAEAYAEIDAMGLGGPLPVPPVKIPAHWPALVICRECRKPADHWKSIQTIGYTKEQIRVDIACHGEVEVSVVDRLWVQLHLDSPWFAFEKKSGGAA
jgi:hypothetical protein